MKKHFFISLIFAYILIFPVNVYSQCKQFAKNTCKVGLAPYHHDGNYHAAILVEGEEAELYKTFYSDIDYRIGVCGASNLGNIEFSLIDNSGKVIYNNKSNNYDWKWDFRLESSQQLKIVVKIPVSGTSGTNPVEGCVAIMFGLKNK